MQQQNRQIFLKLKYNIMTGEFITLMMVSMIHHDQVFK